MSATVEWCHLLQEASLCCSVFRAGSGSLVVLTDTVVVCAGPVGSAVPVGVARFQLDVPECSLVHIVTGLLALAAMVFVGVFAGFYDRNDLIGSALVSVVGWFVMVVVGVILVVSLAAAVVVSSPSDLVTVVFYDV